MSNFEPQTKKTKSGLSITIRSARNSDASALMALAKAVVEEDAFQLLTPSELEITVDSEEQWIGDYRRNDNRIILVAEQNGFVVGHLDFCNGHRNRIAHTGEFGMAIVSEWRGMGIGTLLVGALLEWAKNHERIEKIGLNVHSTNLVAIALYKKMGFEVEGVRKRELRYGPKHYVDTVVMGRFV